MHGRIHYSPLCDTNAQLYALYLIACSSDVSSVPTNPGVCDGPVDHRVDSSVGGCHCDHVFERWNAWWGLREKSLLAVGGRVEGHCESVVETCASSVDAAPPPPPPAPVVGKHRARNRKRRERKKVVAAKLHAEREVSREARVTRCERYVVENKLETQKAKIQLGVLMCEERVKEYDEMCRRRVRSLSSKYSSKVTPTPSDSASACAEKKLRSRVQELEKKCARLEKDLASERANPYDGVYSDQECVEVW